MKALTLHHPWAHLVSVGAKTFETRSWRTNYRGLLAIHSSLNLHGWDQISPHAGAFFQPFDRYCTAEWGWMFEELSYGSVVAIVRLKNCYTAASVRSCLLQIVSGKDPELARRADEELAFGDFSPGRWAWELELVCAVNLGLRVRGYQHLWTLPNDHEQQLLIHCAANGLYPTPFRLLPSAPSASW